MTNNYILLKNVSVNITTDKINFIINKQIEALTLKGPIEMDIKENQKVFLTPQNNATVTIKDDRIEGMIPLLMEAEVVMAMATVRVEGDLNIHFNTHIALFNNTAFQTTTEITDVEWLRGPDITPKLVDWIVPDALVEDLLDKSLPKISDKIDEALNKNLKVDALLLHTTWHRNMAIPLKNNEFAYLAVKPEYIGVMPVAIHEGTIRLSVESKFTLKNSTKNALIDENYVPEINFIAKSAEDNLTHLELHLDLQSMEEPALRVIKSVGSLERAIRCNIEKIMIRPVQDEGIAIALKLSGALNGGLSIAGKPYIEGEDLMLYMDNMSFDFSGKNIFSSLTGNIALSVAKSFIRKQFPIQLEPYITSLTEQLNEMIANLVLIEDISLKGSTKDWELEQLSIENGVLILKVASHLEMEII